MNDQSQLQNFFVLKILWILKWSKGKWWMGSKKMNEFGGGMLYKFCFMTYKASSEEEVLKITKISHSKFSIFYWVYNTIVFHEGTHKLWRSSSQYYLETADQALTNAVLEIPTSASVLKMKKKIHLNINQINKQTTYYFTII